MSWAIGLGLICCFLFACSFAHGGIVDLSPDAGGDRIAVVKEGKVAYLSAKRADIGSTAVGGGLCRYIKRSRNDDLHVTGPGLGLHRSADGGHTWSKSPLNAQLGHILSAFTVLRDDTFLIAFEPDRQRRQIHFARSTDLGLSWMVQDGAINIRPWKTIFATNNDFLELPDGTILLTVGHAMSVNNYQDDDTGEDLPMPLKSSFGFVYRSRDGGLTWGDRSMVSMYGSEVHLALHPSGKLVAAIRKNRAHRLPGDPTSVFALKQQHGYSPQCDDGLIDATDARISNRIKAMFYCESYDDGYTWVNEQQVATFKQCSGDVVLLDDGTLVMTYDHRYDDHVAAVGIRARVSYDAGATWEPEEYVLGEGENYPDSIATADGGLITTCPHEGQIQAVHWRPLPKAHDVSILGGATNVIEAAPPAPVVCEDAHVSVITNGTTTKLSATRVNMMAAPPPHTRNSTLWYGRNSALIQSTRNGDLYCTGNLLGPLMLKASDSGLTWTQTDLDIAGWGCLVGFRILLDDSFLVLFEPAGLANRVLCTARSSDSGKTWDVRTATLDLGPFTRVWGKDNNVIELPDGTVLAVVQLWGGEDDARGRAPSSQDEGLVHVLRSTDGGRSWGQRASVCGLVGKARLIRLRSGKLLACVYKIRSNQLMLAESNDDGRSWLNARPVATGVNPGGETGNLTQLADGSVLLQFLHDATPAKNPHLNWYEVEGLRAIISHDEGRTWEDRVYVISHQPAPGEPPEGHGAYLGDSIQLANGAVLSTCVHHADTGMRIQAVIWRPQR